MKKRILSLALAMVMAISMAVPAFAAETKNVKITAKYSEDYTYSYTLPKVSKTETLSTASKDDTAKWAAFSNGCAFAGKDVKVYTIKKGEKINLKGAFDFWVCSMEYKDGELYGPDDSKLDYKKLYKTNLADTCEKLYVKGGAYWYTEGTDKSYMSFTKTGYYAFMPLSFYSPYATNGAGMAGFKEKKVTYNPKHGGVVLRVVD